MERTMTDTTNGRILTIPRLERISWLIHGFGTGEWSEGDFAKNEEWRDFRLVILDQVHSDTVHRLERPPERNLRGDALITSRPGLFLTIKTADCLPALVVDEDRRVIAAVHCGWRGTLKRILERVVGDLRERDGSDPSKLLVALGPCIGPDCYEVGPGVRAAFEEAGFPPGVLRERTSAPDKFLLDLREANRGQLDRAGVKREHVFSCDACTHCRSDLLSYRRDKIKKKRMFAFIGIKG
jgi:YfiH family protein